MVALGLRLNQIGEKIDLVYILLKERPFNSRVFSLEPHCIHKIKTRIIIPSIQIRIRIDYWRIGKLTVSHQGWKGGGVGD